MRKMINELGNQYGSYKVTACTDKRVRSNGRVIWECTHVECGTVYRFNGNMMRAHKIRQCPVCEPKKNR